MYVTSLAQKKPLDENLFPLLVVRSCVSDCSESRNGPRYCAQDRLSGTVYEVRVCPFEWNRESNDTISNTQKRIDQLVSASSSAKTPSCVVFPIDIYIQDTADGETVIAAVEPFCGLSLADTIRSGWNILEEGVFYDLLKTVETFALNYLNFPPHGNISPDMLKQSLSVRDGSTEFNDASRWVVGDWLLPYEQRNETHDIPAFLSDIEWMLHSSFAQLNVASDVNGSFIPGEKIEGLINATLERIRYVLENDALFGDPQIHLPPSANDRFYPPAVGESSELALIVGMTLQEKIAHHQNQLRNEQNIVNKHRRKNEPLPPRPLPASAANASVSVGNKIDYSNEDDEYELQYLTSPVRTRPSAFLLNGVNSGSTAGPVTPREKDRTITYTQPHQQREKDSNANVLDAVVDLAVLLKDRRAQENKNRQGELRSKREAQRTLLARYAAVDATARRKKEKSVPQVTPAPNSGPVVEPPGVSQSRSPDPKPPRGYHASGETTTPHKAKPNTALRTKYAGHPADTQPPKSAPSPVPPQTISRGVKTVVHRDPVKTTEPHSTGEGVAGIPLISPLPLDKLFRKDDPPGGSRRVTPRGRVIMSARSPRKGTNSARERRRAGRVNRTAPTSPIGSPRTYSRHNSATVGSPRVVMTARERPLKGKPAAAPQGKRTPRHDREAPTSNHTPRQRVVREVVQGNEPDTPSEPLNTTRQRKSKSQATATPIKKRSKPVKEVARPDINTVKGKPTRAAETRNTIPDNVRRGDIRPVHEASLGIAHRLHH
ncbi:hypothetical protein, conserved [Angomonas deanei]|uniref:Uncharacterized protein n=1 Tax=Angomonas deanei TaxID=59799 RepID=A0A7G2CGE0_9TRYP|nr:hypothetical protein, conserved [Angomonas deanei]